MVMGSAVVLAVSSPQGLEQAVQQGDGRGLPVRARDAHERQLPARMSVERIRRHRHRVPAVRYLHEGNVIPGLTGNLFADDRHGPFLQGLADVLVPVGGEAADGDEEGAGRHLPGVPGDGGDVDVLGAADFHGFDILYEFSQFHFKVSRMVSPFLRAAPGAGCWAVTWPVPSYTHL